VRPRGILNINALMDLLCVTRQTAINYIRKNKIPAYKVGPGKYLISLQQLIRTIEDNPVKSQSG
jgi:excisionase family DNA binding protein